MKTIGAIIQARVGSTRLPGKALVDIGGRSLLARVVDRVRRASTITRVIVATTTNSKDDRLAEHVRALDVDVYRGSEEDVLDRYYQAATHFNLDIVVRVTSDCPLLDPGLLDQTVALLLDPRVRVDYAANTLPRRLPRGLDVEAVPFSTLARVWTEATSPHERAHVFPYVYEHPDRFTLAGIGGDADRLHLRWTVDTSEDLAFVRAVYSALGSDDFTWMDVLRVLDAQPHLLQINALVPQKSAHEL